MKSSFRPVVISSIAIEVASITIGISYAASSAVRVSVLLPTFLEMIENSLIMPFFELTEPRTSPSKAIATGTMSLLVGEYEANFNV